MWTRYWQTARTARSASATAQNSVLIVQQEPDVDTHELVDLLALLGEHRPVVLALRGEVELLARPRPTHDGHVREADHQRPRLPVDDVESRAVHPEDVRVVGAAFRATARHGVDLDVRRVKLADEGLEARGSVDYAARRRSIGRRGQGPAGAGSVKPYLPPDTSSLLLPTGCHTRPTDRYITWQHFYGRHNHLLARPDAAPVIGLTGVYNSSY